MMRLSSTIKTNMIAVILLGVLLLGWLFLIVHAHVPDVNRGSAFENGQELAQAAGNASTILINPTHIPVRQAFNYSSAFLRLTAGLRPGPGAPIPAAQDLHVLPVTAITFYDWRGNLLSGWLALHTPQAPVIILVHGTPGNRLSMLSRAVFLYAHGYNVLLFDFQSYGQSQGVVSTLGLVESEDILAAITYIHSLPMTTYSKIGVLGLSMGATAAILAATRTTDIVALVADSCPVDATRVTSDVPNEATRAADRELVEDVYGVDITAARPIDNVGRLAGHTALFFINGTADKVTPLAGMYRLYAAASGAKSYWVVPRAQHAEAFLVDPTSYIAQVNAFFDRYLL